MQSDPIFLTATVSIADCGREGARERGRRRGRERGEVEENVVLPAAHADARGRSHAAAAAAAAAARDDLRR